MSKKSVSSGVINHSVAQQTHSHSASKLFRLNQLTCGILAASALLFAAPGWAASPTEITDQAGATAAGMGTDTITLTEATDEQVINNAAANAITLEKKITGKGKVTKKNDGTVTLNITGSDYSGETLIQNGVLKAGKDNVLSANSSINLSKETVSGTDKFGNLDLNNTTQTIKGLKGLQGTKLKLGTGTLNINFDSTLTDQTFSGLIEGEAGSNLNKKGTGILELGAMSNDYKGSITIEAGELKASTGINNVIGNSKGLKLSVAAAKFNLNNTNQTVGKLTGMGTVELGTGNLTVNYAKPGEGEAAPAPADITFSGPINGTGGLTKAGTGKLILSGAGKAYTGVTTISGGTLQFNAVPIMTASVTNNANLVFSIGAGTGDLPKVISGTGSVEKMGGGELVLAAANTYEGKTTISGGELKAGIANAFSAKSDVDVKSGATLILGAFGDQGIGTLSGAGTVDLKAVNLTINSKADSEFSGKITGTGGLTLDKAMGEESGHVLTLSGTGANANDYTGLTTITAGTLKLGAANAIATSSGVNIAATGILDLGGFDQNIKLLEGAAGGEIHLGDKTLTTTLDAAKSFAGVIKGEGGSLTKAGNAVLTLSGANEYTGITTISGGTLKTDNAKALGTSAVNITTAGAVLELGTSDLTIGALTGIAGSTVKLGTHTLTLAVTGTAENNTFGGVISADAGDNNGNLTKEGTGTLKLTGANTYTGKTTVKEGSLELAKATAGAVAVEPTEGSTASLVFDIADMDPQTQSNITGSGNLVKQGKGNLTLAGTNSGFTGNITVSDGTLKFAAGNSAPSMASNIMLQGTAAMDAAKGTLELTAGDITLNNLASEAGGTLKLGTANLTLVYAPDPALADASVAASPLAIKGTITGGAGSSLIKDGEGTLVFSGTATDFNGATTVKKGTLQLTTNLNSAITIDNGATLEFSNAEGESLTYSKVISNSAAVMVPAEGAGAGAAQVMVKKTGKGTVILSADNTYTGETIIEGGTLQFNTLPVSTKLTIDNSKGDDSTLAINNTGNVNFDASKIVGTEGTFKKTGAGELTLNVAASQFAGTTLVDGGTLKFGIADAIKASVLNINATTGIVDLANNNQTFAGLEGAAGGELKTTATGNLTLNTAADKAFTFDGKITGAGTVTKTGAGTQIFNSADNSTTGAITVNTGTLLIGDATHSTAKFTSTGITVASAATLGGFGTITAPVTVSSGGFLSPGSDTAVGTLTIHNADLTFKTGSTLNYNITDANAADGNGIGDQIKVTGTGTVHIENDSILKIKPGTTPFKAGHTYTVISSETTNIDKQGTGFKAAFDSDMPFLELGKVDYDDPKAVKLTVNLKGSGSPEVKEPEKNPVVVTNNNNVAIEPSMTIAGQNTVTTAGSLDEHGVLRGNTANEINRLTINADQHFKQGYEVAEHAILQVGDKDHGATSAAPVTVTVSGGNLELTRGSTLQGYGTLVGNVQVRAGGTISPGGSPGTLVMNGTVAFHPDSNLLYDITRNDQDADLLKINGGVTIDGANLIIVPDAPTADGWRKDHAYTVLTANKVTVTKPFNVDSSAVDHQLPFLKLNPLQYTDTAVSFTLTQKTEAGLFTQYAQNRNQLSVARALSALPMDSKLIEAVINTQTVKQVPAVYNNLSPEIYASASDSLLQNSHYVRDAVLQNHQPDNQVWITTWGHGGRSQGDHQYTDSSVSNQGWGVAVGSDVVLAKHVSGGLMAGYERTTVNGRDASDARARINTAHIGTYLRADLNSVNLNGGVIYSFLDQNTDRRININTLQGKLNNDNSGHQVQLFAELNRDFHLATSTTLTPYVNVAHVWQTIGESTEKAQGNAGPAALRLEKDNKGVTFTGLGLRGAITLPTAVPASLQFAAGWQHAFGDTHSAINSHFADGSERISTHGTGLARDSALINTGLNIKTSASSSLTISYQGEFGAGHTDNAGKLQWQLQF